MPLNVVLGSAALAVGVVAFGWVLFGGRRNAFGSASTTRANKRVMMAAVMGGHIDLHQAELELPVGERIVQPGVAALARRARRLTPRGLVESLERRIAVAGVGDRWPIERVLAAKVAIGLAGLVAGVVIMVSNPGPIPFLIAAVLIVGGYFLPDYVLANISARRQDQIQTDLADTLDQITVTVEAGLGFEAAVDRVARQGTGPLKRELLRMLRDIELGASRAEAIENVIARTTVRELKNFLRAVAQAGRYGIPIAQILRVQSAELRDKRRQRAEEQAAKVAVKMTIPMVTCILPALFIVVLGPAVLGGFGN